VKRRGNESAKRRRRRRKNASVSVSVNVKNYQRACQIWHPRRQLTPILQRMKCRARDLRAGELGPELVLMVKMMHRIW
jgi:hypothetical protein